MTRNDSDWISDLYTAEACDWTPMSVRRSVRVLFAPVSGDPEVTRRCGSLLSDAELERADRFVTGDLKAHFIQRRAFRRYCGALALGSHQPLSRIAFDDTDKGRPYLPDLPDCWFSFSSSRSGFLGAWSSTHAVGVDLEDQTQDIETTELAQQFFSAAEAKVVKESGDLRTFLLLWCLKEAALKSIGEGLPVGLDAFEFELTPTLRVVRAPLDQGELTRFRPHLIGGTDSCAALVIRSVD